jgi:NAD(P)-dependent dehydrogenase (short-subunit alcohol dehydrogenase family)
MPRTYVITGSAAGIGKATGEILAGQGARIIGVDLRDADVIADLESPAGRQHMLDTVGQMSGGKLDGIIASAGLSSWFPSEMMVSVNFFGAIATLDGLRPLLRKGDRPRAVVLSSYSQITICDADLVDACLAMDEERARVLAEPMSRRISYNCSKRAIARWVRRMAPSDAWAGAGIALNAVSPGITDTPQNAKMLSTPEGVERMKDAVPMPYHGIMTAEEVGRVVAWLATPESSAITGQMINIDGGAECVVRGDDIWEDCEWPRSN